MEKDYISISLDRFSKNVYLEITLDGSGYLNVLDEEESIRKGESPYQIAEGCFYEYELIGNDEYGLRCKAKSVVRPSRRNPARGRIEPNIFVGCLRLEVYRLDTEVCVGTVDIEVLATKFDKKIDQSYRENYRQMLEDITDCCTELLMETDVPIYQSFEVDYNENSQTLYQRFCFVQSFVGSTDFEEALLQVFNNPSTTWNEVQELIPIGRVKRIGNKEMRQFTSSTTRIGLGKNHTLVTLGINSLPQNIYTTNKVESYDTPENRFILFALRTFCSFIENCEVVFKKNRKEFAEHEAHRLSKHLNRLLSHPFFDEIQEPQSLKLNSPTLQKRAGYREVLNRWLQFELASRLIWNGGEDVYEAGKKDIAKLYEYWLYFQLYDLMRDKFGIGEEGDPLIEIDKDRLHIKLKGGNQLSKTSICTKYHRPLAVRFSYNKSFRGGTDDIGKTGSWTTGLRPDYTLSVWSAVFSEKDAEIEDAIVHIHFDAKYKIQDFQKDLLDIEDDIEMFLEKQDIEERKGSFKNADLLKMHAYKDAIRRTGGAYLIYPGGSPKQFKGFHEILPGLGAFSVTPSRTDTGIRELSVFVDKVIQHLLDRTSQRERIANKANRVLREEISIYKFNNNVLPSYFDKVKADLIDTQVLVGYCKSAIHKKWCIENKCYNVRIKKAKGVMEFHLNTLKATYLVLRESDGKTARLFKINKELGVKIYTPEKMLALGYPNPEPKNYLMVAFEDVDDFKDLNVNYKNLRGYLEIQNSGSTPYDKVGKPFIATLKEVLNNLKD